MNNPLKYTDPSGENPLLLILAIAVGFTYLYNAHANTPQDKDSGNPANWAWNPANWNSSVVVNAGYNTGGNWTFSGGVGNPNGPIPMFGYNTQYGAGAGMSYNGNTSFYYPEYEAKVNNTMGQAADKAVSQAREEWASYTELGASLLSTGISASAGMKYSSFPGGGGFWIGKNGQMYSMSLAGKNGGYIKSLSIAKSSTALARGIGNTLGIVTTAYSAWSFYQNPNWEDGIGTAAGVAGYVYCPAAIGYSYYQLESAVTPWKMEQMNSFTQKGYDPMTEAAMLWGFRRTPY
jgi:hypothetical protein